MQILRLIQEIFPEQQNIYAVIGDHDVFPPHNYDFENRNEALDKIMPYWRQWMYENKTYEQFYNYGYYTQRTNTVSNRVVNVICLNSLAYDP